MAAATFSPIQVVLDARQFQAERVRQPGQKNKEFFDQRDADFVAHKARVAEQLGAVKTRLLASSAGRIGFVKVQMREDALAKSHRPIKTLFHPNATPVAGSAGGGRLIFQVSPLGIDQALSQIQQAENKLTYRPKKKKPNEFEPNPSRQRSEVGAIQSIKLWDQSDRRGFSPVQALRWFESHAVPQAYRVDLFETLAPAAKAARTEVESSEDLVGSLMTMIDAELTCGYVGALFKPDGHSMLRLYFWLFKEPKHRHFVKVASLSQALKSAGESTLEVEHHQKLLELLGRHPAVRRVSLPPALKSAAGTATPVPNSKYTSTAPLADAQYPVVGIIDGGVGKVHSPWIVHAAAAIDPKHGSQQHGSEIAGLLIAGQGINGPDACPEPDGCRIVDLAMIPMEARFGEYYGSDMALTSGIEQEVVSAKAKTGARVFCFSHNFDEPPGHTDYPELTAGFDRISREHDVIFVISAGNTLAGTGRKEWQLDQLAVLSDLAAVSDDRLTSPADAVFGVSVAALNPPDSTTVVPHAPARYSRRGSTSKHFVKPDVAHYGGICGTTGPDSGLQSTGPDGAQYCIYGTSYSGPLVAKTLAHLDLLTGSRLPREALTALLIHGSKQPECLAAYDKKVARHLVGFGLPTPSQNLLAGTPHRATLLFFDEIQEKKDLFFNFDWPKSLVRDGKCRGKAELTVVYSPPIVDAHDGELVRINLEAVLRQRKLDGTWDKRGEDVFNTATSSAISAMEKHLVEDALKWGTVKHVQYSSEKGRGASSEWQIWLKYLLRASETFPETGVPFAIVLTISDSEDSSPVYQDMKLGLTSRNVLTSDIRADAGQAKVGATPR